MGAALTKDVITCYVNIPSRAEFLFCRKKTIANNERGKGFQYPNIE